MQGTSERWILVALVMALSVLVMAAPAQAVEDGLFDVRIGASYRELLERFGTPHGILFPSGSGMVFQTTSPAGGGAGLPDFSQAAQTAEIPVYVLPIRASVLEPNQVQWTYDFRDNRGIAIGMVLNGEGADAVVSDVIVTGFPQYLKGKPDPIRTARGIVLQSTFEEVLRRYGYPPLIEIYPPSSAAGTARGGAGGAMRAGGAARGGMRAGARAGMGRGAGGRGGRGGRGGMRGGPRGGPRGGGRGGRRRGEAPNLGTRLVRNDGSSFELVLTGGRGMRGGMRGGPRGGMRGGGARGGGARGGMRGGMRGGARGGRRGGRAALPPLGAAARAPQDMLTATAVVNHQAITFSRDCIMIYEGISFTLHNMKVYRIHVSE